MQINLWYLRPSVIKIALTILVLSSYETFSQNIVTGIVYAADDKPVEGVSVYINNTSIGTITNSKGYFTLRTLNNSFNEIVFSSVGYSKEIVTCNGTNSNCTNLKIRLQPHATSLEVVSIKIKNKENWAKWGKLFHNYFLGESGFAKECKILNPEVIRFRYNKQSQVVSVTSKQPVFIQNNALGYILRYDLDSFSYCFKNNVIFRKGFAFFENIKIPDRSTRKSVALNRLFAYRGSAMHFLRTAFNNTNTQQGYTVYRYTSQKNVERERVNQLVSAAVEKDIQTSKQTNLNVFVTTDRDSARYYDEILKEPRFKMKDSVIVDLSKRIDVSGDSTLKIIDFSGDTLLVKYTDKNISQENDGSEGNRRFKKLWRELNLGYDFINNYATPRIQYSLMLVVNGDKLSVKSNGNHHEKDLFTFGFMSWRKVAYALPWDYEPYEDEAITGL